MKTPPAPPMPPPISKETLIAKARLLTNELNKVHDAINKEGVTVDLSGFNSYEGRPTRVEFEYFIIQKDKL